MEKFFDYFNPSHYALDFRINSTKTELTGVVSIDGEAKNSTVKLHAVGLNITKVSVDTAEHANYQYVDGVIQIFDQSIGTHQITVEYTAPITADMQGAYLSTYQLDGQEERIVVTQFESHYARECFPCVDEPVAKATFDLRLTSEDPEDTLVANMPVAFTINHHDSKVAEFQTTPRMSTYLVAFAVGKFINYEAKSKHGVKITAYAGLHQKADDLKLATDFAADVLDFYDDLFKVPYPLPKLDLLALPDFEAGAMENWGLMTFREIALLADDNSALDQKLYVDVVVAHEISHMWFGDLVTMAWWDDLWLNESFANMMEIYATDKVRPNTGAWDYYYTTSIMSALRRDCLPGVQPVRVDVGDVADIANLFDGSIVYSKGSRLLLMLMRIMGEYNFFKGITDYFNQHKYGNTKADDLWNALSPYANFDVREFMNPWLTQPGYPVITGTEQHRFLLNGEAENFQYPIRELREDLSGHYLINLSEEELVNKLQHTSEMGKEQKLRLLIDRRYLAKTHMVASASLLPLIKSFTGETDPVIWKIISSIIADLKIFFEPKTPEKHQFRLFLKDLVAGQYQRLGVVARPEDSNDDTKLRPIIMSIMLYVSDPDFVAAIEQQYINTDIVSVNPNLRWVVGAVLVKHHDELSRKYFDLYCNTVDASLKQDLADALSRTHNHDIAVTYLDDIKNGSIRPQDRFGFLLRLAGNYIVKADVFNWLYANWDWLATEEGDKTISDYPRYFAGLVKTQAESDQYHAFFSQHEQDATVARDIKVAYAEIAARLDIIAFDHQGIYDYLAKQTTSN